MAIVDAYVVTNRIIASTNNIVNVLSEYDSDTVRRKGVNKIIRKSRISGNLIASRSRIGCWMLKKIMQYSPTSTLLTELTKCDKPNKVFVESTTTMKDSITKKKKTKG